MNAKGTFEITGHPEPPYDTFDGVTLARVSFDKRFSGALEGSGQVQMIGARTPVEGSAGYVAIERVTAVLRGRPGTFALQHTGIMNRGTPSLTITVVPDSGTDQLAGLAGTMAIIIAADGKHSYEFDYTLAAAP